MIHIGTRGLICLKLPRIKEGLYLSFGSLQTYYSCGHVVSGHTLMIVVWGGITQGVLFVVATEKLSRALKILFILLSGKQLTFEEVISL